MTPETFARIDHHFRAELRRWVYMGHLRGDEFDDVYQCAWVALLRWPPARGTLDDCPSRFFRLVARRALYRYWYRERTHETLLNIGASVDFDDEEHTEDPFVLRGHFSAPDFSDEVIDRVTFAKIARAWRPKFNRRRHGTSGDVAQQTISARRQRFTSFARRFVGAKNAAASGKERETT